MYTALYYPHTTVKDESLMKTSLLLWDQIECISPFPKYQPQHEDRNMQAASELVAKSHIPSDEEKRQAHEEIEKLVNSDLPGWFVFTPENPHLRYEIYPDKFLDKTWEILENSKFVERSREKDTTYNIYDYTMTTSLGLTLMSILAECCAGSQKRMLTDEVDSYGALTRYITQINGGEYKGLQTLKSPCAPSLKADQEKLLTVSFKVINVDELDLSKLIELRRREANSNDTLLRDLRHNYFNKLDTYITQLAKEARHKGDQDEIARTFEQEMESDLNDLKKELKFEARKTLLSKEVFGAIVATALSVVEPISTSIISVGLLGKTLNDYRAGKRKALKNHAMSWLYQIKPSKIY